MARRSNPKPKIIEETPLLVRVLLFIPELLIGIGDIVLFFVRLPFVIIHKTYNAVVTLIRRLVRSARKFIKSILVWVKPKRSRGRPKKKYPATYLLKQWIQKTFARMQEKTLSVGGALKTSLTQATHGIQAIPSVVAKTVAAIPERIKQQKQRHEKRRVKQAILSQATGVKATHIHVGFPKLTLQRLSLPTFSLLTKKQAAIPIVPFSSTDRMKSFVMGVLVTAFFLFIPYISYQWLQALPNPQLLSRRDLEVTTKIFDRNGKLLYEIYADQNRTPIPLEEISDVVKEATIAIEDREFYHHQGISVRGIARAAKEIFFNNRIQGGSTITQQLIKSALLSPEVKITRKIKEVLLAFWAERLYSKNQILEMYLNQVPYGGTAWGVEAASQTYFGKSVHDLNLAEAALLAGLPAAPTEYSPFGSHPEKSFDRQREVLRRMEEDRYITREEAEDALNTPIQFAAPRVAIRAPHFVMYVKDLLEKRYGPRLVEQGGLRITTSLDIDIQEKVEDILRSQIDSLASLRVGNGAALVTNPKTGEILSMVGSKNYFDLSAEGNVNVTTSLRQPGSSIKVVTYAAALENGYTAASIIDDSPIVYNIPGSPPYSPVNYDGKFHGPTPFRYALANSYNIPAVKILAKIGLPVMMEKARLMGISSWTDESRYGLSLTLGGGDVTMLEMAKVFGTLANEGKRMELLPILEVTDYTGRVIEKNAPKNGIQAIKPETAWIMSNILSDNTARIAAFGPNSSLVIPGKTVSVKTGTSNDKRDNWTIGYTPSYVTTVWVGNNDNSPMNPYLTSGVTGAAPIWHDIMAALLLNTLDDTQQKPEDVTSMPCYFGRPEYFIQGTEPAGGRCGPLPTPTPSGSPTPNP